MWAGAMVSTLWKTAELLNIPPELGQAPMAITHFGSSIWSYTWRSGSANLWTTRPETIRRSAWRGEERNASIPKRAMSYRLEKDDIISIAQQARAKGSRHN